MYYTYKIYIRKNTIKAKSQKQEVRKDQCDYHLCSATNSFSFTYSLRLEITFLIIISEKNNSKWPKMCMHCYQT